MSASNQKKCRYCAMVILQEAEYCPHCRKKLTSPWGCLVVIMIFGCFCLWIAVMRESSHENIYKAVENTIVTPLIKPAQIIKKKHPNWTNDICNAIAKKEVFIGMTTEQARMAWGKPYKINITTSNHREMQQWVVYESGSSYLYFANDILTSIQQSTK